MLEMLNDYDWMEAFAYAGQEQAEYSGTAGRPNLRGALPNGDYDLGPFGVEAVTELYGAREGQNDEESWLAYGRLQDGRYFYLEAWCDYTGWDCQAGGTAVIANSRQELERFGLDNEAREVFGVSI